MGYQRNKTYVLAFEEPDLAGLEIKARGASVQIVMHAAALADSLQGMSRGGMPSADQRHNVNELISLFGGCLAGCQADHSQAFGAPGQHFASRVKSWNFEDEDGQPLSPTPANFAEQDLDLTLPVIMAWIEAVAGAGAGPLDEKSTDGSPSAAESIPMETLSDGRQF